MTQKPNRFKFDFENLRMLASIIRYFSLLMSILGLSIYFFQDLFIFKPDLINQNMLNPGDFDLKYENVTLENTDDVKIKGWFIYPDENINQIYYESHRPTMIYFHSNSGNIDSKLAYFKELIQNLDINIFVMAHRGYSHSEGEISEFGFGRDSDAILRFLLYPEQNHPEIAEKINRHLLFIYGDNIGANIALKLENKIKSHNYNLILGLILNQPFISVSEIAKDYFTFFQYLSPFQKLIKTQFDSKDLIQKLQRPVIILNNGIFDHQNNKKLQNIITKQTRQIYDLATNSKFKEIVDDQDNQYINLNNFISKCILDYTMAFRNGEHNGQMIQEELQGIKQKIEL